MSSLSRWFIAAYAILLLALLPWQSLWLDELMEVVATRPNTLTGLITGYALHSAGQSPLGSIEQWFSIHVLGFSNWSARLPAALCSIGALWGMLKLAERANVAKPWLCVVLLATIPLQLRYAAEARPYSQALCVSVWLTYLVLNLSGKPRLWLAYFAILCVGLYTQPFVVFVAAAHFCWLLTQNKRQALQLGAVIMAACVLYLPWYLAARGHWSQEVSAEGLHFHWQAKLPLVILRELLGTGYIGTALALLLIACAWRNDKQKDQIRRLMLWSSALPVVLTVFADAKFDYFFAIRQVITVLPAILVLVAYGIEYLESISRGKLAQIVILGFLALNLGYTARWFTKPREDWDRAAQIIAENVGSDGCYLAIPSGTAAYYEFFHPELKDRLCTGQTPANVVLAISPYVQNRTEPETQIIALTSKGYALSQKQTAPQVDLFKR